MKNKNDKNLKELMDQFLTHLDLAMGYAHNTIETYRLILQNFILYLENNNIEFRKLNRQHIEKYVVYLRNDIKNSAKSIRLKLACLKTFLKYLTEKVGLYNVSPIADDDFKYKVEKKEAKSISQNQVNVLLDTLNKEKEKIIKTSSSNSKDQPILSRPIFVMDRDIILIKLLISTGIRISEVLDIQLKDIDFVDKSITVSGKGNRYRTIFFDVDDLEDAFKQYLNSLKALNLKHDYIFVNIRNYNKLTSRAAQMLLKKYLEIAGLSANITPHTLRHTFATITIEKGANIKAVSQMLGHANVLTTINTYTHLSNEHVREVIKMYNPLSSVIIPLQQRVENRKKSLVYFANTG